MARKVRKVVDVEKNERAIMANRRRRTAGRIFAIVFVLLYIGLIAGSAVLTYKVAEGIWNENIGNEAGVPFKDVFTILKGVRKADEKAIVTNAYSEDDLSAFYANIKRKMYLADGYDLDIKKILGSVLGGAEQSGTQGDTQGNVNLTSRGTYGYDYVYVYRLADGSEIESVEPLTDEELGVEGGGNDQEQPPSAQGTGNSALDGLLSEIEFDFSSLSGYDGSKNILEVADRQLAAFIGDMLSGLGEFVPQMEDLQETVGAPLNDVLEVKQIIISGDTLKPESIGLKITLNVKLRDLVSGIVDAQDLPKILKKLMPQNLFASVTLYPCDRTRGIQVAVNKMSEVNVDKIVRIADVILKKTGSQISISKMLVDVNSKVVDVIEKAQNTIPLSFVPTQEGGGNMQLYPIETLMKTLKVDVSEQAFLYMLRDIKLPTANSLGFDVYTAQIKERDTQAFVAEVSAKYGIDNSQGQIGTQNTISDVMNFAQGDGILNKVNLKDIDYSGDYVEKKVKVGASYQALSNMLSSYINQEGMMGSIKAEIVNMSYPSPDVLSIDIEVNVAAMLGFDGENTMSKLIKQLIPESIFATANIDLAKDLPAALEINKVGVAHSQEHLQTLTALATAFNMDVSALSYDSICSQVENGIKQGLGKMKEQLGYDIVFDKEKAYLPSLYELISSTDVINGELAEDEHYFTPEEIRKLLKHLYTRAFDEANNKFALAENFDAFIEELYEKYFISDAFKAELQGAAANNTLLECFTNIGGDSFKMTNIRLDDIKDIDTGKVTVGLKSRTNITDASSGDPERIDGEIIQKFKPVFSVAELAYLIGNHVNFAQTMTFMTDVQIVFARNYSAIGDDCLELVLKGKGKVENANATSLLPEFIYMGVKIDLGKTETGGSRSDMQVFEMDVHELDYLPDGDPDKIQDLQLLVMLIDRVNAKNSPSQPQDPSDPDAPAQPEPEPTPAPAEPTSLEKIVSDIEVKLNGKKDGDNNVVEQGFKDKIHNDVFTVTFVDGGGFRLDQTVYGIALNSIYGDKANAATSSSDKPSEIDFRNAVCKVNNMLDSVDVDGAAVSLATSNKTAADRAIDEINDKFAFGDAYRLSSSNMTGILTDIGNKASNYATAIDGKKLTSDYLDGGKKTVENLRPEVREGELLNFLENSVRVTAEGYEDTKMFGLYITKTDCMTIVYMSKIKAIESKFSDLLPKDIAMLVSVDMSKLLTEDNCAVIAFNDLTASEVEAIEGVRNKMNSSAQTSSLDKAAKDCSDSVKDTMKSLTDNMQLEFEVKNGVGIMRMQSIYEIAADKVSKATSTQSNISAQMLKSTLEALFAPFDLLGYTGAAKEIKGTNSAADKSAYNIYAYAAAGGAGISGALGDGNISFKIDTEALKTNLGMANKGSGSLVLKQSAIASAGDSGLDGLRASLGSADGASYRLENNRNYYLLTLGVDLEAAIGSKMSILPEELFVTVFFDTDDGDSAQMIYNSLTDAQTDTLVRLMRVNASGAANFTDSGNLASVKNQLLGTTLYDALTLGSLFERGQCSPLASVVGKDAGVVVGTGAIVFDIS